MPKRSPTVKAPPHPPTADPAVLRQLRLRDRHQTTLEHDSVVEILSHLYNHRVEANLTATADGVVKRLWVRDGHVVFATSSHRGDSLWAFLLRERMMSLDLLREVAFERANTNRRYGALLLERGLISPRRLHQAIQKQLEHVTRSFFELESAVIDLEIGPPHEHHPIQIALPLPRLILDGCREGDAMRRWPERLGGVETVLSMNASSEELIDRAIDEDELALLRLVDGRRTVAQICAEGPHEPDQNGRLIYALASLGLLKRALDR